MANKGFTLIELLLYVVLLAIVLPTLTAFSWSIVENGTKSATEQEVYSNARYISERLKFEIRNAKSIVSVTPETLRLQNLSGPDTVMTLTGGNITVDRGTGPLPINSADAKVIGLTFTDYSSASKSTQQVQIAMTVVSNFNQARKEYQQSVSLEVSQEVRSH